eukprot:gene11643-15593_t
MQDAIVSVEDDDLFDYEGRGIFYIGFIRAPINICNMFRRYCCAYMSRNYVTWSVSISSCMIALGVTYYLMYWMCKYLIIAFYTLGTKYNFSSGEQHFMIVVIAMVLCWTIATVIAYLYYLWSREIAKLFTRFENEFLPEYNGNIPFNELGVTFELVDDFILRIGGRDKLIGLTTKEISDLFMKDITKGSGVSYSEMMLNEGSNHVKKSRFMETMMNHPEAFNTMLAAVDVENSTAFKPSDRDNIFQVIRSTIGFHRVNKSVMECIRNQLVNRMKASIENQSMNIMLRLKLTRSLSLILKDLGNYDLSLEYSITYLNEINKLHGVGIKVCDAYYILSEICVDMGYTDCSFSHLQSLVGFLSFCVPFNDDTMNEIHYPYCVLLSKTQRLLAHLYTEMELFGVSEILLDDCLKRFLMLKHRGVNVDAECMLAYAELATLYHKTKRSEKAADICFVALDSQWSLPSNHPYILEISMKRIIFEEIGRRGCYFYYHDWDSNDELSRLFDQEIEPVIEKLREKYGHFHPKSIDYLLSLHPLYYPDYAYSNAIDCYAACKKMYVNHPNHPRLIQARMNVDNYTRNVPRYIFILFTTIICIMASYYFAFQSLKYQNNHRIVRNMIILQGFFDGLSWVNFVFNFILSSTEFLPMHIRSIKPITIPIFTSLSVVPYTIAVRASQEKKIRLYYILCTLLGIFGSFVLSRFVFMIFAAFKKESYYANTLSASKDHLKRVTLPNICDLSMPHVDFIAQFHPRDINHIKQSYQTERRGESYLPISGLLQCLLLLASCG